MRLTIGNGWRRRTRPFGGEYGYFLLLVPVLLIGITLLAVQGMRRSKSALRVAGDELDALQSRLCARQCAALAANAVGRTLEANGRPTAGVSTCPCGEGRARFDCRSEVESPSQSARTDCYGLEASRTEVTLSARCGDGSRAAALEEEVGFEEIPLFQFAVFFDKVLEIHPGQDMDITGRIHGNDTVRIYPTSHGHLRLFDWVTSAAAVEGCGFETGEPTAAFPLADGSGPGAALTLAGTTFQPLHKLIPSWETWRKAHRVAYGDQAGTCGKVKRLGLPLKGGADAHALIEWRRDADESSLRLRKYAWRADLLYKDGGWKDRDLRSLSLPNLTRAPGPKAVMDGPRVAFWEARDTVMVKVIPVDVEQLLARGRDSVIFLYDSLPDPSQGGKDAGGFLLHHAGKLDRPLTIATNSRLYVWGDYNTSPGYDRGGGVRGPYPAALAADLVTQLSNEWDGRDHPKGANHNYGKSIQEKNPAARTTLNACILAGMVARNGSWGGQGGYHNFIHFIENWKATEFAFSGSAASLWSARVSTGTVTSAYYYPPVRKWAFDPMYRGLGHMPPATPRVAAPRLASWEMSRGPW